MSSCQWARLKLYKVKTLQSSTEFKSKTTHLYADMAHTELPRPSSESVSLHCCRFFLLVVHSLMDEMKYPVLHGWIPAQVKLRLTAFNALVSLLNEVKAFAVTVFHGVCPIL